MSKRKFSYEPMTEEQIDELAKVYPTAVETKVVTTRKPVYRVIAMLLECGLEVPGVQLIDRVKK